MEEVNEMLVCEDKYEVYRLGFKRGVDRGYDKATRQSERDIVVLQERITSLSDKLREADRVERALKHSLDDKIMTIVVLRHVNEELKKQVIETEEELIDLNLKEVHL